MAENDSKRPIIIKKIRKVAGGHHGGAWKVAYADFVTAMMAFFLLLWLLNTATKDQLKGIADYFKPTAVAFSESGSGGVLGGASMAREGSQETMIQPTAMGANQIGETDEETEKTQPDDEGQGPHEMQVESEHKKVSAEEMPDEDLQEQIEKAKAEAEERAFKKAEQDLREAIEAIPELKEMSRNLLVDMTPEGLRIQIADTQGRSMFPLGKAAMYDDTYQLLSKIAQIVEQLPNKVSIRGHTDGVQYSTENGYNNWDLSADRANASRKALVNAGVNPRRIASVVGKADTDHLFPEDATSPQNRRISIILLREHPFPAVGGAPVQAP
jgi:chemotaxis protein MotB